MTIHDFKDRHHGESCILLGNGPSLARWYRVLPSLRDRYTLIGINRSYVPPMDDLDAPSVTAKYHVFANDSHVEVLDEPETPEMTFCFDSARQELGDRPDVMYLRQRGGPDMRLFRFDWQNGMSDAPFAGLMAMQGVAYMGFREWWLLGFDARSDQGHHCDGHTTHGREAQCNWYAGVRDWAKHRGDVRIWNASPDSAIGCFEKKEPKWAKEATIG